MNELISFLQERYPQLLVLVIDHLYISGVAVLAGFLVACPLGVLLTKMESLSKYVMTAVNAIQTIPSLALLGLMIPLFGIGKLPAIAALFLYSLLPIVRNTYTGLKQVDVSLLEAARGMGMNQYQILFKVQAPLATPVIIAGLRTAAIYTISWATLAAFIGGGGIGYYVVMGLTTSNNTMLLVGAIATALLATVANILTNVLQMLATPKGLRNYMQNNKSGGRQK
ncbi:ABC transporter permease [Cohnella kolymensis]|uniref:ABC transporter permease n=1 Tax=Cohnella kolymensis TaxID=1590652 RepID=UPI000698750E|nr:ABC transporter permease [Cohnella kolymensis]